MCGSEISCHTSFTDGRVPWGHQSALASFLSFYSGVSWRSEEGRVGLMQPGQQMKGLKNIQVALLKSASMESVLDDTKFEEKYGMAVLLQAQGGPLKKTIL